jgi:predicted dinucleotide-binding enzyme
VVKIFNTTGANNMENSKYRVGAVVMFYRGDDAGAKKTAAELAADLGFDPINAGGLAIARLREPLAMLWIHLAYAQRMGRDFAFSIVRR